MSDYTDGIVDGAAGLFLLTGVGMFIDGTINGWPITTDGTIPKADAFLWMSIGLALLLVSRL